ncbi:MAG: lactate utilization protein C [Desulfatirhabdiaceae bacterium]
MEQADLVQKMTEKAGLVQAVVSRIDSFDHALAYAVNLTREKSLNTLTAPGLNPEDISHLSALCQNAGLEFVSPPLRNHLREIHTALTHVDWGIAETGSLVIYSDSEDLRIATMLCDIHVACLPASRIYPDSASLTAILKERMGAGPGYLSFITGASRTADIERVLTIGVHGPLELHILLLEDHQP